ncbi:MAG: hypothetical protein LBT74_08555 [Acidobacteriota bacterium]|jgi:sugar lactone lactonase YvrE|nr:hypothetical protein [Acidobacteriota bacterium]
MRVKGKAKQAAAAALAALALAWRVGGALAVTPRFWEDFTQAGLLAGRLDRVSLSPDGALSLAPAYEPLFDTGQPYIFSLARDGRGNLYAGTGGEGKVFKVDPKDGGRGDLYFQAGEPNVFALALDGADALYVATSPDGKIYKVTGEGQSSVFCDLQVKYVWALAVDDEGNLYAGTGVAGVVYKIDREGNKSAFYASGDAHVRSLAWRGKNLLAGTSPDGKVVEIAPDGKGFTLADTPLAEINALAVGRNGTVYAAASSSATGGAAQSSTKPAASSAIVVEVVASDPGASRPPAPSVAAPVAASRQAKSSVYAIDRDGNTEEVFASDQAVYDVAAREGGALLLATGPKGRLLELDAGTGRATLLAGAPEEDAVRLLDAADGVYVAMSNRGKVYRLQAGGVQAGEPGLYESDVLDAGTVASWGRISWIWSGGDGGVAVSTRVGNTATPDGSWSAWSEGYDAPGAAPGHPRARYLQWRATFKAAGRLSQVRIAYLQQNVRPKVTGIERLPAGVELQAQPSLAGSLGIVNTSAGGRSLLAPRERGRDAVPMDPKQVLTPGAQSFTWKAEDENEDALEYAVYFREEAGDAGEWRLLAKNLKDAFYTLDTAALPDGAYRLKVTASDEPSNPPETALSGEKVSNPFVVASATPRVEVASAAVEGRRATVRFRASVASGSVASAEYSVDGGAWRLVFPEDGVADSAAEDYRFSTPELEPGEHLIGVRAGDRGGATGTARVTVKIP